MGLPPAQAKFGTSFIFPAREDVSEALKVMRQPMEKNRRRHLRKVPEKFAFLQIERDEVGKVLNVSEGGLSFSSFTPIPQTGPLYFWMSFNLKDRIDAMAEVAWTDSSRKTGGLRFVHQSQTSREQLRNWLSRMPAEQAFVEEGFEQPLRKGERSAMKPNEPDRADRFVAKARSCLVTFPVPTGDARHASSLIASAPRGIDSATARRRESGLTPPTLLGIEQDVESQRAPSFAASTLRGIESAMELVPLQRHLSVKKRQLVRGVLLGICLSAIVAFTTIEFKNHRTNKESKLSAPTESSFAKNDALAQPPALPPASTPSSFVEGVRPAVARNTASAPGLAPSKQVTKVYGQASPFDVGAPPTLSRPSARNSGQPQSSTSPTPSRKPRTPRQLWAAMEAGNTGAAVDLAELYIKGEGVARNCQQARVLLLMASEKRNTAAIKRLHELDQDATACP